MAYDCLLDGTKPIYDILSSGDRKALTDWLKLRDNKYEFTYVGSENLPLQFSFKNHWTDVIERQGYENMIAYITEYENKEGRTHTEIHRTISDKYQMRFFLYNAASQMWTIQHLLSDITLEISARYFSSKKRFPHCQAEYFSQ
jgi:hypothetical protein